jgi:hypothetical protein
MRIYPHPQGKYPPTLRPGMHQKFPPEQEPAELAFMVSNPFHSVSSAVLAG